MALMEAKAPVAMPTATLGNGDESHYYNDGSASYRGAAYDSDILDGDYDDGY